jgi:tetratricopeptide (TPR) repeat protein
VSRRFPRARGVLLPALSLAIGMASGLAPAAATQDIVHIATGDDGRGRTKATGEIVDYVGDELRLKLPGGTVRAYRADRIVRIETERTREQQTGDERFAAARYVEAAQSYEAALRREDRAWMQREILAQLCRAQRAAGRVAAAGDSFVALVRGDPETRHVDAIPLAWLPGPPSAELEAKARRWIDQANSPHVVLLGASHLLGTPQADVAQRQLQRLTADGNPRIAALAKAQLWRDRFATVDDLELDRWESDVENMPVELRAGPYFLLGRALAHCKRFEPAATCFLRVPILYPQEAALAARSLLEAGRALEKLDRPAEAARLYREVVADHADDPAVAEARDRLTALDQP